MHAHHHHHSFFLEPILKHTFLVITFVFSMMLIIEFLNYFTAGRWKNLFFKNKFKEYLFCSLLGLVPGCLGGFLVISLFSHGIVGLGALTAALIASSGDESFIMLSLIPKHFVYLSLILFVVALCFGYLTDFFIKNKKVNFCKVPINNDCKLIFSKSFNKTKYIFLSIYLAIIFLISLLLDKHHIETYFILAANIITFILLCFAHTHFIKEHIINHLVKKHLITLSIWTFIAFLAVHLIIEHVHLHHFIENNPKLMILIASIVGVIPESGPHIIFTELFSKSLIPFSILLANSISQDGHASILLFAESKKTFFKVKLINLIAALIIAYLFFAFSF
jgi:hypothetical protein